MEGESNGDYEGKGWRHIKKLKKKEMRAEKGRMTNRHVENEGKLI